MLTKQERRNKVQVYLRNLRSTSGKSSKLDVSSIPLTSTAITAGRSLQGKNRYVKIEIRNKATKKAYNVTFSIIFAIIIFDTILVAIELGQQKMTCVTSNRETWGES